MNNEEAIRMISPKMSDMVHVRNHKAYKIRNSLICMIAAGFLFSLGCNKTSSEHGEHGATATAQYEGKIVKHDGTDPQDDVIYVVSGGKRHRIPNMNWFRENNKSPGDVVHITKQDLDSIPEGDPAK